MLTGLFLSLVILTQIIIYNITFGNALLFEVSPALNLLTVNLCL